MSRRASREGELLAGKYRLEALLGSGGMGEVYRAENTMFGRAVAIKVLREEHAENADLVARFLREARAANIVRHPNVVDILDIGQDDSGAPFIVQELLEGEDLGAYLTSLGGRIPIDAVLEILLPVMDAVGVAHAKGVVHRDLKPENVFLAQVGTSVVPKVLDFGIARIAAADEQRMTATGISMGTPAYMSPEQIHGDRTLDARSDVWALGVILHEVIAGDLPFHAETFSGLFVKIATEAPMPLEKACPGVPAELAAIVAKCIRRSPAERYANAAELAIDLRRLRERGAIMMPAAVRKSVRPPLQERMLAPTESANLRAGVETQSASTAIVPDLDLPIPTAKKAAIAQAPQRSAAAGNGPIAFASQGANGGGASPVRVSPAVTANAAARAAQAHAVAGLDPFSNDLEAPSGLALQQYKRQAAPISLASVSRAGLTSQTPVHRDIGRETKDTVVGVATLWVIVLVVTGALSTFIPSGAGWPTITWITHLDGLPIPMTIGATVIFLVLGLVSANEGYRATPMSWGLLIAAGGLLVDAFGTAGFFASALPNVAGPAAADAMMRLVFPWTTMLIPFGIGVHLFRNARSAWFDDDRTRGVMIAIAVAVTMFAAMQIARGSGAPIAASALTHETSRETSP